MVEAAAWFERELEGSLEPLPHMENCRFSDDVWTLTSADAAHVRKSRFTFRFDVVLGPNVLLNSVEHIGEKLAAKEFVYWACKVHPGRSLQALYVVFNDYLLFVRWRHYKGIPSNRSMNKYRFDDLFDDIERRGLRGLLPGNERLLKFVDEVRAGSEILPTYGDNCGDRFSPARMNEILGLPSARFFGEHSISELHKLLEERGIAYAERKFGVSEQISSARVHQFFRIFNNLFEIRGHVRIDPLIYYPFSRAIGAVSVAKRIANTHERRTRTIPPRQVCCLLNTAIEWVLVNQPPNCPDTTHP